MPRALGAMLWAAALVAAAAADGPAHGAEAPPAPDAPGEFGDLDLDDLFRLKIVTASGVEEDSDLAPANVFTVLGSEIASQGWRSLAEVLEHVPGLYVVDDHVTANVAVRGASGGLRAGSRIMKVMINGTDVSFRPDLNALIGPELIPIEVVDRIEIARGPLSALYGANAFLATVNVITIEGERTGGKVALAASARPQGGVTRLGTDGAAVVTARINDRVDALLAATVERTDRGGLTIAQTFPAQTLGNSPFLGQTSGRDLARPLGIFGRVRVRPGYRGALSLQGGMQQSDSEGNFQLGSILTGRTREVVRNLWAEAQHQLAWTDALSSSLSLGVAHGAPTDADRLFASESFGSYYTRNFHYDAIDGKASLTVRTRFALRVSAGVDASLEDHGTLFYSRHFLRPDGVFQAGDVIDIPTDPVRAYDLWKLAPHIHASWDPIARVRLSADGRVDFTNLFDRQPSWRAAAGWRILPNLVVKAIAGQAFQTPSTVFLFAYPGFGTTDIIGSRTLGTGPPLVPQVVRSGEVVLSYLPGERLSVNVAGYAQSIDDQITFVSTGPNTNVARNQGTARSAGAELNLTLRLWRFEPYLRVSQQWFAADPTRGRLDQGPKTPPAFVPARWALGGLRLSLPAPRLTFDATWKFVGERGAAQGNVFFNNGNSYALPGYNQLDVSGTTVFNLLGRNRDTRVLLGVRNVLHARRFEPGFGGIDLPSLARTFQASVTQSF